MWKASWSDGGVTGGLKSHPEALSGAGRSAGVQKKKSLKWCSGRSTDPAGHPRVFPSSILIRNPDRFLYQVRKYSLKGRCGHEDEKWPSAGTTRTGAV